MLHIGGDKILFQNNIIGMFSCEHKGKEMALLEENKRSHIVEYVTGKPYRTCVLAMENGGISKVYFTSVSIKALTERLLKKAQKM